MTASNGHSEKIRGDKNSVGISLVKNHWRWITSDAQNYNDNTRNKRPTGREREFTQGDLGGRKIGYFRLT